MTDNNSSKLDYEPLGCICSGKGVTIGLYIFAGVLVIAGIIVNFAVMSSIAVFAVFIFLAVLSAFCGVAAAKNIWYWGEEKFTIMHFLSKPVTFSYDDIERIYSVTEGPAVTILFRMNNGKEYGLTPSQIGTKEFLEYLDSKQDKESTENV
ncbi:MAG: hypothetical protein ACI4YB_06095 [Oscillospiraceae bacterium]